MTSPGILAERRENGFGTGAVLCTTPSTIPGPILFLRMGYAVAGFHVLQKSGAARTARG